jgi:hypothetical protein
VANKIGLIVNNVSIKLDEFVESYVYHVTEGIVASLKNTGAIKKLELNVEDNGDVKLVFNGKDNPLNYFVTEIVRNTLAGMVSNLKGVSGKIKTLSIKIE